MSARLGRALAQHILGLPGDRKFVLVEGVEEDLAVALAEAWDAAVSACDRLLASRALRTPALTGESGTALRDRGPVCLVICEGSQLPDRQSLRAFESVAPGDLLTNQGPGAARAPSPLSTIDGPARPVRGAIVHAGPAARPSASAVAAYLDRCASGESPLHALPARRIRRPRRRRCDRRKADPRELRAAARRRSEEPRRPADLRRRAQRVLARRPGLSTTTRRGSRNGR